jgi:hypothetical protein
MHEEPIDILLPKKQEDIEDVPLDNAVGVVSSRMGSTAHYQKQ